MAPDGSERRRPPDDRCKHLLTIGLPIGTIVEVADDEVWAAWERIRTAPEPDPLEVLRVAVTYVRYFNAVEDEAIAVARKLGKTWDEIADALGQSRQAVWQRAHRNPAVQKALMDLMAVRWSAVKDDPQSWYEGTRRFGSTPSD